MDTKLARETLSVIRKERKQRLASLPDHPDAADAQWLFSDEPFINELCLILLVAIRHQVERELLSLASRATDDGATLTHEQYRARVKAIRQRLRQKDGWMAVCSTLRLDSFPDWNDAMETLRLLANCYKHAPSQGPEPDLLRHLQLDEARNYAPLPESSGVREGLTLSLGLGKETDYCEIAEEFLSRADRFLKGVQEQPFISRVKWGPVSPSPRGCRLLAVTTMCPSIRRVLPGGVRGSRTIG